MESILLEKGFVGKPNNVEKIFESTIKSAQSVFGKKTYETIVSHAEKNFQLQEKDLVKNYQIFSKVLPQVVGLKATKTLIREITERISLDTDWKYDDLSFEKIFDDISRDEIKEFLKNVKPHDHVLLIFESQDLKDNISEYFLKETIENKPPKIIFSKNKDKIDIQETMLLDSFFTSKNELVKNIINQINEHQHSNPSKTPAKIICKDMEWWYEKGLVDEHQKLEQEFGPMIKNNLIRLCMVVKTKIKEEQLYPLFDNHNYVIFDKPFKIFSKIEKV